MIRLFELHVRRPLQWLICQLHANELPLRHLIRHLDGNTTGPFTYCGPIGKLLDLSEQLPIVKFRKIAVDLPTLDVDKLSTDQKYLYQICQAISSGNCPTALSTKSPGKLSHARWLTTANRVLRLYIGTEEPSLEIETIVEYIVKVYAKVWFLTKTEPSCTAGAQHLWEVIHYSRYLSDEQKLVVDPVIQRNGFYGHPENLLIAMINDKRSYVRKLGFRRIMKARTLPNETTRDFVIPPLNFHANDYTELINWQNCSLTEPPLTKHIPSAEIEKMAEMGGFVESKLWNLPCHTQAVERAVKIVSEASSSVCGTKSRDGFIRTTLASRKLMPNFENKAKYKV